MPSKSCMAPSTVFCWTLPYTNACSHYLPALNITSILLLLDRRFPGTSPLSPHQDNSSAHFDFARRFPALVISSATYATPQVTPVKHRSINCLYSLSHFHPIFWVFLGSYPLIGHIRCSTTSISMPYKRQRSARNALNPFWSGHTACATTYITL